MATAPRPGRNRRWWTSRTFIGCCAALAGFLLGAGGGDAQQAPGTAAPLTAPRQLAATTTVRVTAPGSTTTVTSPPRVRSTTVTLPAHTVRVAAPARTTTETRTRTRTRTVTADPGGFDGGSDGGSASYANCSEARAAGVTPLHRGDPGYARHLDRDGDGVACE